MIKKPTIELDKLLPQALGVQIAKSFTARLGDPSQNYKVKVDETDKKGLVYIHGIGDNPNGAYTAENTIGLTEFTPQSLVKVGYSETNRFEILGLAPENSEYMDGVNRNDQVPVNRAQILDGNIITNDSATVQYKGTFYVVDSTSIYRTTDQATGNLIDASTDDTSATAIEPPSTSNTAIMVLVQINPSTNTLSYKQSASFPASYSDALIASGGFFPAPDENNAITGYVKLINGVTTLKQEHLTQLPDMYRVGASGGSSVSTIEHIYNGSSASTANLVCGIGVRDVGVSVLDRIQRFGVIQESSVTDGNLVSVATEGVVNVVCAETIASGDLLKPYSNADLTDPDSYGGRVIVADSPIDACLVANESGLLGDTIESVLINKNDRGVTEHGDGIFLIGESYIGGGDYIV